MPDPRRRFCLTSRPVIQSTPEYAPEEVTARVVDHGLRRPSTGPPLMPFPVLPVIMTCGNMEFTAVSPGSRITERTRRPGLMCDRSQTAPVWSRTGDYSHSEQPSGPSGTPPGDGTQSDVTRFTASVRGSRGCRTHGCADAPGLPGGRRAPGAHARAGGAGARRAPWWTSRPPGAPEGAQAALRPSRGRHNGMATRITRPPPSRGSAVITPPCARATERAMDRPSPTPLSLPVRSVRSRRKGSKRLSTS